MKLVDTLLLAAAAGFFFIGVYEAYTQDVSFAYPYLMLAVIFFFWFNYRRRR